MSQDAPLPGVNTPGRPAEGTDPVAEGPTEPSVVEWGGTDEPRRARRLPTALAGLRHDRRLVPVTAGLGAVAIFASLVSEWQHTTVDREFLGPGEQVGDLQVLTRLGDLGAWGGGYLAGVFVLTGALALVLFGPRGVGRGAHVVALSSAGVLLALLAAVAVELGDESVPLGFAFGTGTDQHEFGYGRGLPCAVAGVLALALAVHLAGRLLSPAPGGVPAPGDTGRTDGDEADSRPVDWPWRRPRAVADDVADDEPRQGPPIDLTVEPATPFTAPPDGRDGLR